jgi:hypothetical protein
MRRLAEAYLFVGPRAIRGHRCACAGDFDHMVAILQMGWKKTEPTDTCRAFDLLGHA